MTRPMKVLVFVLAPLWSPHFETDLELVLQHIDSGDDVVVLTCRGALQSCIANPYHRKLDCATCRSRCDSGLATVGERPVSIDVMNGIPVPSLGDPIPQFESVVGLRDYEMNGLRLGLGAASSLVSILRDSDPQMSDHRDLTNDLLRSAAQMAHWASEAIDIHRPDHVYVFNGRFATAAAVVEVCRDARISFSCHDSSYSTGRYRLTESGTVHDLSTLKESIERTWRDAPEARRASRGTQFFEDRRFGGGASGPEHLRFSARQVEGEVPGSLSGSYVAILNSSEDEFSSMTQYSNPVYPDQIIGLKQIVDDPRLAGETLVLRVHPNLMGLSNAQTSQIEELVGRPNLRVVTAEAKVDTYALMEKAKAVVTFGSTTGIEAVYWGVPSILVGRSVYEDLGVARPVSHEEVVSLILDPPAASDVEGALKFGYFTVDGGKAFQYYDQEGYNRGRVDGRKVRPNLPFRIGRFVRNAYRLLAQKAGRRIDNRMFTQR